MVEKFKKIAEELKNSNVSVLMLAYLKMDEISDRWSIILGVKNITEETERKNVFELLVASIRKNLDASEISSIARVGVFPKENHLIDSLLKYKPGSIKGPVQVNGNMVHEGEIIISEDSNLESAK